MNPTANSPPSLSSTTPFPRSHICTLSPTLMYRYHTRLKGTTPPPHDCSDSDCSRSSSHSPSPVSSSSSSAEQSDDEDTTEHNYTEWLLDTESAVVSALDERYASDWNNRNFPPCPGCAWPSTLWICEDCPQQDKGCAACFYEFHATRLPTHVAQVSDFCRSLFASAYSLCLRKPPFDGVSRSPVFGSPCTRSLRWKRSQPVTWTSATRSSLNSRRYGARKTVRQCVRALTSWR